MKPIALTGGDFGGIGPEISALAWQELKHELCFAWIGDPRVLPIGTSFQTISSPSEAESVMPHAVPVIPLELPSLPKLGRQNPEIAATVITSIKRAVDLAQEGLVAAVCTNPINKDLLQSSGDFLYPGHTEFLAALAGVENVVMMLACPELRVVPATIHVPLANVPKLLTPDLLRQTIKITHEGLQKMYGIANPRLALSGLNPHAGENGQMGHEDDAIIAPVIAEFRAAGMAISGPYPADTMFHAKARANYDVAIAMYHDQALIPIKTINFSAGVNVTLGLPFIRTSPDHGTAYDIAGKGIAEADSLVAALRMAAKMAKATGRA